MSIYDPAFHFDASIASSYTLVGGKVSSWTNQYGGQLLTQTVDAYRPTLTTQNGLTAFAFTTVNETRMENSTGIPMSFGSYCIVYKNTNTSNYSSPIATNVSNNVTHGGGSNTLINGNSNSGGGGYTWINRTQVGTPTDALNAISRTLVNNIAVQTQTFGSTGSTGFSGNLLNIGKLGTYEAVNGTFCEIVFFKKALSDANRITVVDYLISKWGVVV